MNEICWWESQRLWITTGLLIADTYSEEVSHMEENRRGESVLEELQDARYVIKSVICDPNFERLVLGCIEADFCK